MSDTPRHFGPEIQGAIYLRGLGGAKPDHPDVVSQDWKRPRKEAMTPEAWAYIAGGAGLRNDHGREPRGVRSRVRIAPHMLAGAGAA